MQPVEVKLNVTVLARDWDGVIPAIPSRTPISLPAPAAIFFKTSATEPSEVEPKVQSAGRADKHRVGPPEAFWARIARSTTESLSVAFRARLKLFEFAPAERTQVPGPVLIEQADAAALIVIPLEAAAFPEVAPTICKLRKAAAAVPAMAKAAIAVTMPLLMGVSFFQAQCSLFTCNPNMTNSPWSSGASVRDCKPHPAAGYLFHNPHG